MKTLSTFLLAVSLLLLSCDNDDEMIATADGSLYFPFAVGNRWEYEPIRKDVLLKSVVFTVVAKKVIGDKDYFAVEKVFGATDHRDTIYYRVDARNFVFERAGENENERDRFRLEATDGYTWNMHLADETYVVTTSVSDVTIGDQMYIGSKTFSYNDPEWVDEEHYFILAKGVGIIQFGNAWGFDYKLKSAYIVGSSDN